MQMIDDGERMYVCKNPYQGRYKRVLAICSAGLLRSPTTALVLSQPPFSYNTRSAGIDSYALIPVDKVLLHWADEIVCVEQSITDKLRDRPGVLGDEIESKIVTLDIPDQYPYRSDVLQLIIKEQYTKYLEGKSASKG
jgi:predicted protein tyrosine phosphatase